MTIQRIIEKVNSGSERELSKGMKGALLGHLNLSAGSDEDRKRILGVLFNDGNEMSSKSLTPLQWGCLEDWIAPQEMDGAWYSSPEMVADCEEILNYLNGVYTFE